MMRVVIGALLAAGLSVAVAHAAEETVLQRTTGNGIRSLRPFTATKPFEVQWQADGTKFEVYEFDAVEGKALSFVPAGSQTKPGSGSTYRSRPGSYYLRIISDGEWTVTVVQLP